MKYPWAIAALATLLFMYLRAPDAFTHPQFWAEDGAVYYAQMKNEGVRSVLNAYSGGIYITPRLVAFIASFFSAVHAPVIFNGAAILVACWVAGTIAAANLQGGIWFGFTFLLAPSDGVIFGSLTHIQWVLSPALAVIAVSDTPLRIIQRANEALVTIAAGLCGPFVLFAVPLFAYRVWRLKDWFSVFLLAIALAATTIQLYGIREYVPYEGERRPLHMALAIIDRVFGMMANGWRSETVSQIALAALFAGLVTSVFLIPTQRRVFLCLGYFAATILVGGWVRFMPSLSHYFDHPVEGDRYFYFAKLICLWALIAIVLYGRAFHKSAALAGLVLVAVNFTWWKRTPLPVKPWHEYARSIDDGRAVKVPIQPEGWVVAVGGK